MKVTIRNAGQEREEEPMVMKKTLERVVHNMKQHHKDMVHHYEHKLKEKNFEVSGHVHNEGVLQKQLRRQVQITWIISACTFLTGVGAGCLIH